jgi:hypothetical protein
MQCQYPHCQRYQHRFPAWACVVSILNTFHFLSCLCSHQRAAPRPPSQRIICTCGQLPSSGPRYALLLAAAARPAAETSLHGFCCSWSLHGCMSRLYHVTNTCCSDVVCVLIALQETAWEVSSSCAGGWCFCSPTCQLALSAQQLSRQLAKLLELFFAGQSRARA